MNYRRCIGISLLSLVTTISLAAIENNPAIAQQIPGILAFRNTILAKHNSYRAIHRSPAMTLSTSLNNTAQSWANQLAASGTFAHSSSTQRNGAGENLYVFYTTGAAIDPSSLANSTVKSWYDEVSKYNYANPGFSSSTGHFTQVVWKKSTQIGCGAARGTKNLDGRKYNAFYVVCNYAPAGNFTGQFPANVLKP